MIERFVSEETLRQARNRHLRELRLLSRMTDEQYAAFRRNFDLGLVDPNLTRQKAMEMLRSMLQTNLLLQKAPKRP